MKEHDILPPQLVSQYMYILYLLKYIGNGIIPYENLYDAVTLQQVYDKLAFFFGRCTQPCEQVVQPCMISWLSCKIVVK